MIIDSHCHIHDEKFAVDLDAVLKRAKEAGVTHMITIGCDIETTKKAQEFAVNFDNIYFSAGFHPHEAKHLNDEAFKELKDLAKHKKCVAIGECGLDFYYEHSNKEEQKSAFIKQISLARELDLPIVVHLRDAFDTCFAILSEHKDYLKRVVIHCFTGTLAEAKALEGLGCYISLSGILTFKKPGQLILVAQSLPLDKLLIETDCPYLAPHPYRGQRNEPGFIIYTLKALANARGENEELVKKQVASNTAHFFGLQV